MKLARIFAVAMIAGALGAACGQPNASDTPGANLLGAGPSTTAPSPSPIATAAAVTTSCTKGQTKIIPGGERVNDSKCGTGAEATRGSSIQVKYVGKLSSGKVFDSSAKHGGKPYSTRIGVGAVIPGWDEGVPGMRVGGVRNLLIPPALAYGSTGAGSIPPNATIEFTIKLVAVSHG
ncbi:MAG: FKBP-type peptidyl-prolyl cis-trans isomerase [Actinomycetota bacterium]|nr:FKBP-type peptidyl-prolyl cis-trans isomerase [Actinomycetota bacterium]